MKQRNLLIVTTLTTLIGCSSTDTYQYIWHKDGASTAETRQVSTQCGNNIGENTISTAERQENFHNCMKKNGYKLQKIKNN